MSSEYYKTNTTLHVNALKTSCFSDYFNNVVSTAHAIWR